MFFNFFIPALNMTSFVEICILIYFVYNKVLISIHKGTIV